MNILTLDIECTTSNKGNPFDLTNKMVVIGWKWLHKETHDIYTDAPHYVQELQWVINKADILVGFNIKFDLHWLKRIGIDISGIRVWDCQVAEFILENQLNPYNSLNDAAAKYGLGQKIDVIKEEFWDKGVDTNAIPRVLLSSYLTQDLTLTEEVFLKQRSLFENSEYTKYPLFKLHCMDLLVLQEMEWNGIKFDTKEATKYAATLDQELKDIYAEMVSMVGNVPFNLSSNDHVSALLYGGTITLVDRIPIGVYKTGLKEGQTRYKLLDKVYTLPRLVEPLKGTETSKSGKVSEEGVVTQNTWKVSEDILRSLKLNKEAKKIVDLLGRYSKIEKLMGTYLLGYTKLIEKMNWEEDTLHGTLNQCVAVTGRLSSSKPNLQNADPKTKTFMRTRY